MDVERFQSDLDRLIERTKFNGVMLRRVNTIRNRLINLYKENKIKINHSVMELLIAIYLLRYGYETIEVEKELNDILRCDVYAKKGVSDIIVEIETGFVPPEHALDPLIYSKARIASKIARYSKFASKFILAIPQQYILPIPALFTKPIKDRSNGEIEHIKALCDLYYKQPPIERSEIIYGRLHAIYILDIDNIHVLEFDPYKYKEILENVLLKFKLDY